MDTPRSIVTVVRCLVSFLLAAAATSSPARAFQYVTDANGTWWGIQDAAPPRVDTGSIRATQTGAGDCLYAACVTPPYSTSINGFGGIKVLVETTPAPRFNGEIMRGYGLAFDGTGHFTTTQSIDLGGVTISRSVYVNTHANWARWLDSFSNTTRAPVTLKAAFGGQSGIGSAGPNSSAIVNTSSGDTVVTAADAWVEVATPLSGSTMVGGPQVTVIGTPASDPVPFEHAMTFAGNWSFNTFDQPLTYSGHDANFQAYINSITLQPGETRSVLHFVVLGQMVNEASSASVRSAVEQTATRLAAAPELGDLTPAEICSIDNFSIAALTAHGFDNTVCGAGTGKPLRVAQAPVPKPKQPDTTSMYDVVGKTIGQLQADMTSGITTSEAITRAYLDRIDVYDRGQFGFHAYEVVAANAIDQARAADAARRRGTRGPLLGIPIAVKNLYDTSDLPTTNGSLTFAGFRPAHDAFQVARLRQTGAVILGKAALEEYATYGNYSNDAWGQVWNVFRPSQSAIASSGGSASAVAASLAAAALGSQTGDSLYGPASGASLVTLRGTDGLGSGTGVMPLIYLTDFGGAMTRTVSDLADVLNAVVAVDPDDPETSAPGRHTPADWRAVLDRNALRGKRIGYIPSRWVDPFGTTNTIEAEKAALKYFADAGATIVEMGETVGGTDTPPAPAAPPGDVRAEGWGHYIDAHPELRSQGFAIATSVDVDCSQRKVPYVRADRTACSAAPPPRLSAAELQAFRDYRRGRQGSAKTWMDSGGADHRGVDAVVYPGLLSDISLNDGGGNRPSFGRRDTPSAANGIPSIAFPVGLDDRGDPINIQLLGRAWDDDKLVGMAYAFEEVANAAGRGHVEATTAPRLPYVRGKR